MECGNRESPVTNLQTRSWYDQVTVTRRMSNSHLPVKISEEDGILIKNLYLSKQYAA